MGEKLFKEELLPRAFRHFRDHRSVFGRSHDLSDFGNASGVIGKENILFEPSDAGDGFEPPMLRAYETEVVTRPYPRKSVNRFSFIVLPLHHSEDQLTAGIRTRALFVQKRL